MISSVPKNYRAFGNSAAQIFLNLFGFLPSPFLYGLICELTGGRSSRWGMVLIMFWSIFGFGTLSFAYIYDKKKRDKKNLKKQQKFQVEEFKEIEKIEETEEIEKNDIYLEIQIEPKKFNSIGFQTHSVNQALNCQPLSFENKRYETN